MPQSRNFAGEFSVFETQQCPHQGTDSQGNENEPNESKRRGG